MKVIHTSNIQLGRSFANLVGSTMVGSTVGTAGDRLRAAIKTAFVRIIDLALEEKADLVIFAGDTFDTVDVSQNLLDYFVSQVERLGETPAVIMPGARDAYQKGSFWDEWRITRPAANLHLLADNERSVVTLERLSVNVYGYPVRADSDIHRRAPKLSRSGRTKHHVAVVYGTVVCGKKAANYPIYPDDLAEGSFDYVALGGSSEFYDLESLGFSGAYSGSPETLSIDVNAAGQVAVVEIDHGTSIRPAKVGSLVWEEMSISMDSVGDMDDLKLRIAEKSGPDTVMKVTLHGLALLEAELNCRRLHEELSGGFLHLEIIDRTRVLPENVSAVKVQEKTILGQYLRVMVDKINAADGAKKSDLGESLKLGYTLLTGKEIW
jgi:DNA repair exonuclease SbcCD nuclease subunit